jgi:hypothetical protein
MKQAGILLLMTLLCGAIASSRIAHAGTITVTSTSDSGPGSLRQALADANNGDTIDFGITGTIVLSTGELLVDKSITIDGPGSDNLTVVGNQPDRVFHISGGVITTLAGLGIMNGGDEYTIGGGIHNDHSTLAIDRCTVSDNHAAVGGGVYNDASNGNATLIVTNSTFSGNIAAIPRNDGNGAGIYNNGSNGSAMLTITNSTFSGNWAATFGGAVYNHSLEGSAALTVTNSTFSANFADIGGGIYNIGSGATVTVGDTILNAGSSGANIYNDFSGAVTSLGYNLSSDAGVTNVNGGTGGLTAPGDQINTDPMLGPLQDNGGPTFTHALLSGSPAIDAGDPSFTPPPYYDQRGQRFNRITNDRLDIGAFEVQLATPGYAAQI